MSTVNAWKYGRKIYLIGRSYKYRYLTDKERNKVIQFIAAILQTRPMIAQRLNLKYENAGKTLQKQNSYALLKMIQVIGRNMKVQFPTETQKTLCDTLIEAVSPRAEMGYKDYADGGEEEEVINIGEGYFIYFSPGENDYEVFKSSGEGNNRYNSLFVLSQIQERCIKIYEEQGRYAIYAVHMDWEQGEEIKDSLIGYTGGNLHNIKWEEQGWRCVKEYYGWGSGWFDDENAAGEGDEYNITWDIESQRYIWQDAPFLHISADIVDETGKRIITYHNDADEIVIKSKNSIDSDLRYLEWEDSEITITYHPDNEQ